MKSNFLYTKNPDDIRPLLGWLKGKTPFPQECFNNCFNNCAAYNTTNNATLASERKFFELILKT